MIEKPQLNSNRTRCSYKDIAAAINVSGSTIYRWLTGDSDPRPGVLEALELLNKNSTNKLARGTLPVNATNTAPKLQKVTLKRMATDGQANPDLDEDGIYG